MTALILSPYAHLVLAAADGELDPTFGNGGIVTTDIANSFDDAAAMAIQVDGKIVVAGNAAVGNARDFALARYLTDGSLDLQFGNGGRVTTDFIGGSDTALAIATQKDGRIIAAGSAIDPDGNEDFALARYSRDGSLDTGFGKGGKVLTDFKGRFFETVHALAIQSDGRIVAAGATFNHGSFQQAIALARYTVDGQLDPTFGHNGRVVTTVGAGSRALAVTIQKGGEIVVAGSSASDFVVVRYNKGGRLDPTFDSDGVVTTDFGGFVDSANALAIQADGRIVAAGNGAQDFGLVRYNPDGSLDASFGNGGMVTTDIGASPDQINDIALQRDGKIVVVGNTFISSSPTSGDIALARYETDGSLDLAFGDNGLVVTDVASSFDEGNAMALQRDGRIVIAGRTVFGPAISVNDIVVARYLGFPLGPKVRDDDVSEP